MAKNSAQFPKKRLPNSSSFVKGECERIQDIIKSGYMLLNGTGGKYRHPLNGLTIEEYVKICNEREIEKNIC